MDFIAISALERGLKELSSRGPLKFVAAVSVFVLNTSTNSS